MMESRGSCRSQLSGQQKDLTTRKVIYTAAKRMSDRTPSNATQQAHSLQTISLFDLCLYINVRMYIVIRVGFIIGRSFFPETKQFRDHPGARAPGRPAKCDRTIVGPKIR